MADVPELLELTELGDRRYNVFQPSESAEGRDVVFSGQLLGQMMMASDQVCESTKDIRSVHAIFARAGTYQAPIELNVDSMQAGRTWASDTVTATQGDRLLTRAMVLMNVLDDDLMRYDPEMPDVPGPDSLAAAEGQVFPGGELRPIDGEPDIDGAPTERAWHRFPGGVDSPAAAQAILSWATCGNIIGLAMRPFRDTIDINEAHRTLSTGVIAHTLHFLDRFDVGEWLLVEQTSTKAANGRVYGRGSVFTAEGKLVSTFEQDSMARSVDAPLDPSRSM